MVLVALLISLMGVYLVLKSPSSSSDKTIQSGNSSISGQVDINGVIPQGASMSLLQKKADSQSNPVVFASNLPVADRSPWSFHAAQENTNYQIQAEIIVNGVPIASSDVITVTAPASNEILTINLVSQTQTGTAVVSGNINVNGYIPSGATITIQGRKLGAQAYTVVARNLPGQLTQFMSYTTALAGQKYEIQGQLIASNGSIIGTSSTITVSAPATNEQLTINSTAAAPTPVPVPTNAPAQNSPTPVPPQNSAISGNINFNGAAPANSRIVILTAPGNSSNYSVAVNNITPVDGSTWSWNGANPSTWYNVMAVLKQHNANGTDTDIAYSTPVTVAAPAGSVVLSINSGVSLSAPGGPITVNCQQYNSGPNQNTWNVTLTFGTVPGAQTYWYQVGSTSGANNTINTANPSNTVTTTFNNNTTYYARYAYSNVATTPLGSSEWSGFTSSTPLQCGN